MSIWIYQHVDVLRGQYIYKKSFSDETLALDEYKGQSFIRLFSGVFIAY